MSWYKSVFKTIIIENDKVWNKKTVNLYHIRHWIWKLIDILKKEWYENMDTLVDIIVYWKVL